MQPALGRGHPERLGGLSARLIQGEPDVREQIIVALNQIGESAALPAALDPNRNRRCKTRQQAPHGACSGGSDADHSDGGSDGHFLVLQLPSRGGRSSGAPQILTGRLAGKAWFLYLD